MHKYLSTLSPCILYGITFLSTELVSGENNGLSLLLF